MKFDEFVNESINEGAVKQFEMGVSSLVRNVKTGYGWIDPSYVYDTFNQADDFEGINWDDVKDEIYQRLIDNNLLYYSSDTDPEQQGKKVTSVKQIQESVNEAARVPSNVLEFAKRKGSYATALVKKAAGWAEKAGKYISNGTAIGKNYSTIILDMKHHGSEIYINLDNETIELFGEEVTDAKSFAKVLATNESVEVNEAGDAGKFVTGTLNTPFDTLKIGDLIKLDALDYTRRGDDEKITCILPDGNKAEVLKKHITVKL